jgi:hypothetical protein
VIFLVTRPLLLSNYYFNTAWLEELWFMWKQSQAIHANHAPTLFLNYRYGVFYPQYAFYGGTLFAFFGTLSLALGDAPLQTYLLSYLLGFASAYGGWYWLSRTCGLTRWWAHAPGLLFVTSPYYLTLIYGRGDWPEFMGVSTIPTVVAAGVSVLRAERLRLWPALALTLACILLFGSHSLTLVWASSLLALFGLALVVLVPAARRQVTRAGAIRVAGLVLPALLVNAWFLVPAAVNESSTLIANEFGLWKAQLRIAMQNVSAAHLFTPTVSRVSTNDLAFQLPVLAIGWALVILAYILGRGQGMRAALRGTWTRVFLICSFASLALIVLMTHAGLIFLLPRAYATLQYSYRLESYVLLALSATLLAGLMLAADSGRSLRRWRWALLPALVVSIAGAIQQVDATPKLKSRNLVFQKGFSADETTVQGEPLYDYFDIHLPIFNVPGQTATRVEFDPGAVEHDRVSATVQARPGEPIYTNFQGPPSLVHVSGARLVGVTRQAYDVLEVDPPAGQANAPASSHGPALPPTTISLSRADDFPIALGRILALVGLLALVAQFTAIAVRHRRGRD